MTDLTLLARRARRSYELGRLRSASKILWWLAPLVALSAAVSGRAELCLCLGAPAAAGAVFLRWRHRDSGFSATQGATVGAGMALIGLGLVRVPGSCQSDSLAALCCAVSLLAGAGAGYWLVRGSRRASSSSAPRSWLIGAATAALLAPLGCANLKPALLAAMALGLAAASALTLLAPRVRSAGAGA